MRLSVNNINDFIIKNNNTIAFQEVTLDIPFTSLFSKNKEIYITIDSPKFSFGEDIFKVLQEIAEKNKTTGNSNLGIKISRVSVKNGELIYTSPELNITALQFNLEHSLLADERTLYRLNSPHLHVQLGKASGDIELEGNMRAEFRQQQGSWKINRFSWDTEYMKITANGRIYKDQTATLNLALQGSMRKILDSLLGERMSIHDFIYGSARLKKDASGKLSLTGQFKATKFTLHNEEFSNLEGNVSWENQSNNYRIDATFKDGDLDSSLTVTSDYSESLIQVVLQRISAVKAANIIGIEEEAPLAGVVRKADISIKPGVVTGRAEFSSSPRPASAAEVMAARNFYIDGSADFTYYNHRKAMKIHCENARGEFGIASLAIIVDPDLEENLVIQVSGNLTEAAGLNKYLNYYVDLDVTPWQLQGGNGNITLDVKRIGTNFFVNSDFTLRDFTSSAQPVASLTGRVTSDSGLTNGSLQVEDKDLTGTAEFSYDKKVTRITYNKVAGESQKILKILGFSIDLSGRMNGDFVYEHEKGAPYPLVQGNFTGKRAVFYGFPFDDVSGEMEVRDYMHIKNLACFYKKGKAAADIMINYKTKIYKLEGNIKGIDFNRMHKEFTGQGDVVFSGAGSFAAAELTANDPVMVSYSSDNVSFYEDLYFPVKGDARIYTDFSNFIIKPGAEGCRIGDIQNPSSFSLEFSRRDGRYSGSYAAKVRDINLLIPWGNNKGEVELNGQIFSDEQGTLNTEGYAVFKGEFLSFPNFPHTLDNFEGDLLFQGLRFTLRSLKGTMGGGAVESSGYLVLENNKLKDFFLDIAGKNMRLYPMDRTSCTLTTRDLTLKYLGKEDKLLFSGELDFSASLWERGIEEPISFNTAASLSPSGSKFIEMLKYNLRLLGRDNCRINNALLDATGRFDLRLTGTVDFPQITGSIECTKGQIEMADNKFDIVKAKATFNKFNNNAAVDLEAETFIKNYHIKFLIGGTFLQLKPQFRSSPPLPPRDILSLLSLGELFERPTTTELSTQVGAGTTGLIAQEITEQIKKRTKKIFGDYVLRINPNLSSLPGTSLEDTSRLIVGKSIAKDFLIVYSTNFSTQRQQVIYVQYQLSPSISLIGMRNEDGRFSIDIRFRKRY